MLYSVVVVFCHSRSVVRKSTTSSLVWTVSFVRQRAQVDRFISALLSALRVLPRPCRIRATSQSSYPLKTEKCVFEKHAEQKFHHSACPPSFPRSSPRVSLSLFLYLYLYLYFYKVKMSGKDSAIARASLCLFAILEFVTPVILIGVLALYLFPILQRGLSDGGDAKGGKKAAWMASGHVLNNIMFIVFAPVTLAFITRKGEPRDANNGR